MRSSAQEDNPPNEHVNRPHLNKVLAGRKAITPALLKKLKVKTVYIRDNLIALDYLGITQPQLRRADLGDGSSLSSSKDDVTHVALG